jgi:hypothetical protein
MRFSNPNTHDHQYRIRRSKAAQSKAPAHGTRKTREMATIIGVTPQGQTTAITPHNAWNRVSDLLGVGGTDGLMPNPCYTNQSFVY